MTHPIFPNGQCAACGAGLDEQECCTTMPIYYVLWVPNEEADDLFTANHPYFFTDLAAAHAMLEEENTDCLYGEYVGPFIVPSIDYQTCQPPSGGDYPVDGVPMRQTIYFDAADDSSDGFGWNVVDGGAIAARFPTLVDAMAWCGEGRYVLRPTLTDVPRFLTVDEIVAINKSIAEWL